MDTYILCACVCIYIHIHIFGAAEHDLNTMQITKDMHSHRAVTATIYAHTHTHIYISHICIRTTKCHAAVQNSAHPEQRTTLDRAPRHTRSLRRATIFRLTITKHTSAD